MKTKNIKYILLILATLIFVLTLVIILTFKGKAKKEDSSTIKVGFVMPGYSTEEGWNGLHYDGIASACEELDIELVVKENVKEYIEKVANPYVAASRGFIDSVIEPKETRALLLHALKLSVLKEEYRPAKKHGLPPF